MIRSLARPRESSQGSSLTELLVGVSVLLLLAGLAVQVGAESMARQRLEVATRRLVLGLERGRAAAERLGRPCGLSLAPAGWQEPLKGSLAGCERAALPLAEGVENGSIQLSHNLPDTLRFSSNGLVLDGGTVVLSSAGTELRRCLVMAPPLGVVRLGRYGGAPGGHPDSAACRPDPTL
ncbi:GspH/FimT family protein [Synechococcus sp. CS-1329]|uniref:GspH/FimT family protein n=1 Tax=Synechococcus sp. CS-1329 TaxID=2847975 RepID=UPI00223BFEF3|nr:GspH/FimT family protein [Synechococcus sp. CS-1329]MCT0218633.1 GspH/FimT family protein [Synechococcus sp. CS-1329]